MKPIAQVYHTLAVAYATTSSEELRNCIIKYSETFQRDNNMGLAKQVRFLFVKNQAKKNLLIICSCRSLLHCIRKIFKD